MADLIVQNDGFVVRGGGLATGQDCCCGCCCIDGAADKTKTTKTACESAGGTWNPGSSCKTYDCRCCEEFKHVCVETVWSQYSVTLESLEPLLPNPVQPTVVSDAAEGVIALSTGNSGTVCGNSILQQAGTFEWGSACNYDGDIEPGFVGQFCQYYTRYRAVTSCDDCMDDGAECCVDGVYLGGCLDWTAVQAAGLADLFCNCDTVDICNNPLP